MKDGFGKKLSQARAAKRLTLRKLGKLVSLSPSFLSELEHGGRMPPKEDEKIRDLAVVLGIDEDDFLQSAHQVRLKFSPLIMEKLYATNRDLALGLYRATENATDEDVEEAYTRALELLISKRGVQS